MNHRSKVGVLLSSGCLLLALFACSDTKAPGPTFCAGDDDCPTGTGCADGVCRFVCTTTEDCPDGTVCLSGYCQTPCKSDEECPEGEHCEQGYCEPDEVEDGGTDGDGGGDCTDNDGDGFGAGCAAGPDCDDTNRAVHPDAHEACHDGIDNDCDGETDEADCGCTRGDQRPCYTGHVDTQDVGLCHGGVMICGDDREYGECIGEQLPADEACDNEDNDCDGEVDEGLLDMCGDCLDPDNPKVEICGDGLDNDCNGQVDESCSCDPNCHCEELGSGTNCECHPPVDQPCYSGNPNNLGHGICRGGIHDCVQQGDDYVWTTCEGEVLPSAECAGGADGQDNDCDGVADEDCLPDLDGDGYSPPLDCNEEDAAINPGAAEICDGVDNNCNGLVDDGVINACGECGPVPEEVCSDGFDNDCDGVVDENCGGCTGSDTFQCYGGPPETVGIGLCAYGQMICIDGEFWSECQDDVMPEPEICDGVDNDCDDEIDERWAIGSNACGFCDSTELCDEIDNDCDGLTDEYLRNACGECLPVPEETQCDGLDNDCDGLIDENLLTACGTCPDVPCYEIEWDTPGDCDADHRDCDGVIQDPADPDSVTLGQGTVRTPFIYISVTGKDEVAKLDTETGEKIWQVSSHGDYPSRTAVALDFSVWVGNRGFSSSNDPNYSNGVHLDADGNKICMMNAPGICRGVAIDGDGNVWFGTYDGQTIYKVSGSEVEGSGCASPPCCKVLGSLNVGVNVYGLAVDGNGYLWTASSPNTKKINTATMAVEQTVGHNRHYGIAIDQNNNVWLGSWSGSGSQDGVHMINGANYNVFYTGVTNVTAVTVDANGYVWGSSYGTNEVVKIDPGTGSVLCRQPVSNGTNPHGVAVDANGKIWVPNRYGGFANRYTDQCVPDGSFVVDNGQELYTYSDMTGMQLRMVTTREGHWIQNFDSGYDSAIWHSATWEGLTPPDTAINVSFVSADTEAELVTNHSAVCGPFSASPADLLGCADLQGHRWLSADVQLSTTQDGARPSFSNLRVFWSH